MKTDKLKPNYRSVYTRDSLKAVDIFDAFQNLRYKVILTSYDISNEFYSTIFEIEVLNCFATSEPLIIVSRPADNEDPIVDYDYALKLFNSYVEQYKNLVKAETRDIQDIEVYKEKIGYELTCPKCCETCKWIKHHTIDRSSKYYNPFARLQCTNPANQFQYDIKEQPYFDGMPYVKHHETYALNVHPVVNLFGCCRNYEKNNDYNTIYAGKYCKPHNCQPHPLDPPWVRPYNEPQHCKDPSHPEPLPPYMPLH